MRYCYVYGQFLATTILGVAYLEITIAALFFEAGRNDLARASITELFKEAHKRGLITDREYEHLNGIRKTRNAYAHFRKPGHKESVEHRAIEDERAFYGITGRRRNNRREGCITHGRKKCDLRHTRILSRRAEQFHKIVPFVVRMQQTTYFPCIWEMSQTFVH